MHASWIAMGDDLHITLCALEVTIPGEDLSISFGEWRDECLAAVGLVTAALDDRIAQDELLEDLVVFDESRSVAIAAVDRESAIRHYRAEHRVLSSQKELFDQLADLDATSDDPTAVAARWLLKGVQAGPTPDGVIALCTAIDSMASRRTSFHGPSIRKAVAAAGEEFSILPLGMKALERLRGDVLHQGKERPPNLRDGYYSLEWIARLLLRSQSGLTVGVWPLQTGQSMLRPSLDLLATWLRRRPRMKIRHKVDPLLIDNEEQGETE